MPRACWAEASVRGLLLRVHAPAALHLGPYAVLPSLAWRDGGSSQALDARVAAVDADLTKGASGNHERLSGGSLVGGAGGANAGAGAGAGSVAGSVAAGNGVVADGDVINVGGDGVYGADVGGGFPVLVIAWGTQVQLLALQQEAQPPPSSSASSLSSFSGTFENIPGRPFSQGHAVAGACASGSHRTADASSIPSFVLLSSFEMERPVVSVACTRSSKTTLLLGADHTARALDARMKLRDAVPLAHMRLAPAFGRHAQAMLAGTAGAADDEGPSTTSSNNAFADPNINTNTNNAYTDTNINTNISTVSTFVDASDNGLNSAAPRMTTATTTDTTNNTITLTNDRPVHEARDSAREHEGRFLLASSPPLPPLTPPPPPPPPWPPQPPPPPPLASPPLPPVAFAADVAGVFFISNSRRICCARVMHPHERLHETARRSGNAVALAAALDILDESEFSQNSNGTDSEIPEQARLRHTVARLLISYVHTEAAAAATAAAAAAAAVHSNAVDHTATDPVAASSSAVSGVQNRQQPDGLRQHQLQSQQ
eukprot:6176888-Pleurochrysis_carterae.AAC.1